MVVRDLDRLAIGAGHRQAAHRDRLAPEGLPFVLDVEDPAREARQASGPERGPRPYPATMPGQSALGRASSARRTDIGIGETSVGKYMVRHRKPPSQTWRTYLENHVKSMVSIDFFTVSTIRFQVLYVILVLAQDRRCSS
jgi:hypothetical protein